MNDALNFSRASARCSAISWSWRGRGGTRGIAMTVTTALSSGNKLREGVRWNCHKIVNKT